MFKPLLPILALAFAVGLNSSAQAGETGAVNLTDGNGLHITSSQVLDDRTLDVTFTTPSIDFPMTVRIVLPNGYAASTQSYPVLYLLHGGFGDHYQWTDLGAEQLSAHLPVILVQPDGGKVGWFADAVSGPQFETFITGQVLPWVDSHLRSWGNRAGRAIAGLSMGGYGTMSYAARHPDLFISASSFSGAVRTDSLQMEQYIGWSPVAATPPRLPYTIFGGNLDNLQAHNPYHIAAGLSDYAHLAFYYGNGQVGPLDPPGTTEQSNIGGFVQEEQVFWQNVDMDNKLNSLGIPHVKHQYGLGMHMPAYWARDLQQELPVIMNTFYPNTAFDYGDVVTDGNFEQPGNSSWACNNGCGTDHGAGLAQSGAGNGWVRGSSNWNDIFQTVNVTPNSTYHLSGWIHTSGNLQNGYFGVRSTGGQVLGEVHFSASPNGYTHFSADVNVGDNTAAEVYAGLWPTGDTWLQVDSVSLTRIGATPASPDGNVLPNGNFEDVGMGSWVCAGNCGTDHGLGFAQSGQGNGWARNTSGWNDIHRTVNVVPNRVYHLSGWVRTSSNPHDGFFGVRSTDGQVLGEVHFTNSLNGYTHLSADVNVGNNGQVDVYAGAWANGDTTVQVDNVSLTPN